ncbi:MAG: DUF4332 domain-containing protein [Deltaproteobacteria bacterium]|nr:DUF4332 domain-containing protein [Deltaproteobacteria bacterium]
MSYYIDDHKMSLNDLATRLKAADLIPSQLSLLDGISDKFASLQKSDIKTVEQLRTQLQRSPSLAKLASESGINPAYLNLLRRAVEGFFPKPHPLKTFDWMNKKELAKLENAKIKNSKQLYEAALSGLAALTKQTGLTTAELKQWLALADLVRLQWVSPTFARVLVAAGYDSVKKIAKANPETLAANVSTANKEAKFYKSTVGLRDFKRLVIIASYLA